MGGIDRREELLTAIVKGLVDNEAEVKVKATVTDGSVIYDVKVADSDVGKVLGKRGMYAEALRTLFGGIYGKIDKKMYLQISDPRKDKDRYG